MEEERRQSMAVQRTAEQKIRDLEQTKFQLIKKLKDDEQDKGKL